jgi:putative transposase
MKTVCAALGVSRSNIAAGRQAPLAKPLKRVGPPAKPDDDLVRDIETIIGAQLTYGYRRAWTLLKREAARVASEPINVKRVYRAMKARSLLLQRHAGGVGQRGHDGKIAVERSNLRWCSDGFELACDNGEKVRIAFALDCCDREGMAYVATTQGIKGKDVRDLMVASLEARFGRVNRLARPSTGSATTPQAMSRRKPERSPAISGSNRSRRPSQAHNPTVWPKPSCAPSSATMPA